MGWEDVTVPTRRFSSHRQTMWQDREGNWYVFRGITNIYDPFRWWRPTHLRAAWRQRQFTKTML